MYVPSAEVTCRWLPRTPTTLGVQEKVKLERFAGHLAAAGLGQGEVQLGAIEGMRRLAFNNGHDAAMREALGYRQRVRESAIGRRLTRAEFPGSTGSNGSVAVIARPTRTARDQSHPGPEIARI